MVAQAGAGEVGHPAVEPARRGHGGAQPGDGDLGARRRGRRGRGRFERAGAGVQRLEVGRGAIAPEADVLARRGVGALDGAQVEHRRAAAGQRGGGRGIGGGSDVEGAIDPDDLPRGGGERQTENEEENRPDDACSHPSSDARYYSIRIGNRTGPRERPDASIRTTADTSAGSGR